MLNPESITILDPACGSGHILVEAYDLLKQIYLERGYQPRAIPRLILEKNLYGLDIDDRAAQMAGFALLMKARADDRRLLDNPPRLNVLAIQESKGLDAKAIADALAGGAKTTLAPPAPNPFAVDDLFPETRKQLFLGEGMNSARQAENLGAPYDAIPALIDIFQDAKTFGSLLRIPESLLDRLPALVEVIENTLNSGDLFAEEAARALLPLVWQASILGMKFDAVIANPPYMGGKGMNPALKEFAKKQFPDSKADLFAMFIERGFEWCKPSGFNSMVTMQSWMFLSSFQTMREKLLRDRTIHTMAHLGARAFGEISGEVVQTTATIMQSQYFNGFRPVFLRLVDGEEIHKEAMLRDGKNRFDMSAQDDFKKIPGSPMAYWASQAVKNAFSLKSAANDFFSDGVTKTGNNERYLRFWWEINKDDSIDIDRYRFHAKGGSVRKYYGNRDFLVKWDAQSRDHYKRDFIARITPENLWNEEGITWTDVTSGINSFRILVSGDIAATAGPAIFCKTDQKRMLEFLAFLNSKIANIMLSICNPTLHINPQEVLSLSLPDNLNTAVLENTSILIETSKTDWNAFETSWDFQRFPWLPPSTIHLPLSTNHSSLATSWQNWETHTRAQIQRMQELETENNRLFIEAYGLQDELTPEVPEDQITLARADREKDCQRLISYAIGCAMGRYSLDEPGLIYAHSGNVGFDPARYQTFPADTDAILPITDEYWFEDDAAARIEEFLSVVWGKETLEENLQWLAESLGQKGSETSEETLRRYLSASFFKDHLQTYKKRPIYWLFSSGKHKAFEALVYLHRYHEGTLARMRGEYVVPLTARMLARIDLLQKDAEAASSASARNKIGKQIEALKKKHLELLAFDEKLRHHADRRIALDLDDGVKVNYGKFGDLLAEVKAVTGGSGDD
jgi:hypothetical protein